VSAIIDPDYPYNLPLSRGGRGVRLFSLSGHPLMAAQQSDTDRRRALELLAGGAKQGCTEAFLLAHGVTVKMLAEMVRAGLATAQIEAARAGSQTRVHITDAGRRALSPGRAK
jgi:hypothetical protein